MSGTVPPSAEGDEPIFTQNSVKLPLAYVGSLIAVIGIGAVWATQLQFQITQQAEDLNDLKLMLEPKKPRWGADDQRGYAAGIRQEFLQIRSELDSHRTEAAKQHTVMTHQINEIYEIQSAEVEPELHIIRARIRLLETQVGTFDPRGELDEAIGRYE